jgi:hypothetical protein
MHMREGAFPPSTSGPISPPTSPHSSTLNGSFISITSSEETKSSPNTDDEPTLLKEVERVEAESSTSGHSNDKSGVSPQPSLEMRRETSYVNLKVVVDAEPDDDSTNAGRSSPAKDFTNPFKATLTNLKRFSALPRTPSLSSVSLLTSGFKASRTPSPSLPPIPVRRKVISPWPAAMQFNDIIVHRSALDRSIGYANKINELAIYDCGLSEWLTATKYRGKYDPPFIPSCFNTSLTGNTRQPTSRPPSLNPTRQAPSSYTGAGLPRRTSHGSIMSEATFPTRADAVIATDLSSRAEYDMPTTTPLLPYPSLAQSSRNSVMVSPPSAMRSLPIPLSVSKSGGFFSSLGRKTSTKKDRLIGNPSLPGRIIPKRLPPDPRLIQLAAAPVVPGGPRAPPGRSQSIIIPRIPPADDLANSLLHKRSSTVRRPSLFSSSRGSEPTPASDSRTSTEFNDQLEKLVILLPHADKNILAGYLRRSGQDILAVGRYLEDEKNGKIIRS